MSPLEFDEVVTWIEDRWGVSDVWANAERLLPDFAHLPRAAAQEALWSYYRAGNPHAPRPSVLLASASSIAERLEAAAAVTPCEGEHLWAHVDREPVLVCVRCRLEEPHVPHDGGRCLPPMPEPAYTPGESRLDF